LLVLNTSSRMLDPYQAYQEVEKATTYIRLLNPDWIFKKTDSVLRGNVIAEISAVLAATNQHRCLLIPANPDAGRTIRDRKYMIENTLISQTSFAGDPEHPLKSDDVLDILGDFENQPVTYCSSVELPKAEGIYVGEVRNTNMLEEWAKKVNDSILPAGAAEFFSALLKKRGYRFSYAEQADEWDSGKTIFICGSAHQNSRQWIQTAENNNAVICAIPDHLLVKSDSAELDHWMQEVAVNFEQTNKLIITGAMKGRLSKEAALKMTEIFGRVIEKIIKESQLSTLAIEGGETAQAVTGILGLHTFVPLKYLGKGVIELSTGRKSPQRIILKPGSYPWPEALWHFN